MTNERMKKLADFIEDGKTVSMDEFGHTSEKHTCETAVCIAGWCVFMNHDEYLSIRKKFHADYFFARKWLNLSEGQAGLLFFPRGCLAPYVTVDVQKERALAVLRGQIELTEDWLHNPIYVEKKLPESITSLLKQKELT